MKLLDPQAVELAGTNLIEASAGTGKTHTIATLYLRLIVEQGLKASEILVVTFTEAATAELRERIRGRIRLAWAASEDKTARRRLAEALRSFDEAAISTIHGFCSRVLRENAFESGISFETELLQDLGPLLQDVVIDFWAREVYQAPEFYARFLDGSGLKPGKLLADTRTAILSQLDLLPDPGQEASGLDEFLAAYGQAYEIWQKDQAGFHACLADCAGLSRKSFHQGNLKKWFGQIESFLAEKTPSGAPPPKACEHFSSDNLGKKTAAGQAPPQHDFILACDRLLALGTDFKRRLVDYARAELDRRKAERNLQSFDDLLRQLDRALAGPGRERLVRAVRRRFAAALIDEFQDTDPVQYRIFSRIFEGSAHPVFLIGDPKQSIYAFRGADIFAYLEAVRVAGDRTHTLGRNYRSDPKLIRAVNTLFAGNANPFLFDTIRFYPVEPQPEGKDQLLIDGKSPPALQLKKIAGDAKDKAHLPAWMAMEVANLLSAGATLPSGKGAEESKRALHAGDIAILVRDRYQARELQAALAAQGVPSVLRTDASVFASAEAADMNRWMRAVIESGDSVCLKTALSTELMGLDGSEVWALGEDDEGFGHWVIQFRHWQRMWAQHGFLRAFRALMDFRPDQKSVSTQARLLALTNGERRLTNFLHLAELLHAAAAHGRLGSTGLIRWLASQREYDAHTDEVAQLRLESDARAVTLVTVHKSKGLQFPVVYCPYLWQGHRGRRTGAPVFHDSQLDNLPRLDLGSARFEQSLRQARHEAFAESLRLTYVALTRAQHLCVAVYSQAEVKELSPLGFLLFDPGRYHDLSAMGKKVAELCAGDQADQILAGLVADADGAIALSELPPAKTCRYQSAAEIFGPLQRPPATRVVKQSLRVASFSSLVAAAKADEGHLPAPDTGGQKVALADFERGTRAGNFFHHLLEELDFTGERGPKLEEAVTQKLDLYGLDRKRWQKPLSQALAEILATPLASSPEDFCLRRISDRDKFCEMEFLLPTTDSGRETGPGLARLFAQHQSPAWPKSYPDSLTELGAPRLSGFLKGFIDLSFQFQGRTYLLDYKSNHLGDEAGDYTPSCLQTAMAQHHYYLQYHIYCVALHRYLGRRLADYDYEAHFGGVFYLFLRGMEPASGHHRGVFADRPTRALIEDLSAFFAGGGPK